MDWTSTAAAAAAIINSQRSPQERIFSSRGMYVRGVCVFAATLNLYNAS